MLTLKELKEYLQTSTNIKISQSDIARALNTSRANISYRMKNDSKTTLAEAKELAIFFNIPKPHEFLNKILYKSNLLSAEEIEDSAPDDDTIELNYYPDVFGSCGSGSFVFSEHKEIIEVPRRCFTSFSGFKKYSIINATGDSMSPYIVDRDKLIVEHWTGEQIRDNRIYLFRFYDNIFIKRLVLNLDQILVKSDNKEYQTRTIERKEADNLQIIGRIVGIWREER